VPSNINPAPGSTSTVSNAIPLLPPVLVGVSAAPAEPPLNELKIGSEDGVGLGVGLGEGVGLGVGLGEGVGLGVGLGEGVGVGGGEPGLNHAPAPASRKPAIDEADESIHHGYGLSLSK
jgi:hypothetical protein